MDGRWRYRTFLRLRTNEQEGVGLTQVLVDRDEILAELEDVKRIAFRGFLKCEGILKRTEKKA